MKVVFNTEGNTAVQSISFENTIFLIFFPYFSCIKKASHFLPYHAAVSEVTLLSPAQAQGFQAGSDLPAELPCMHLVRIMPDYQTLFKL